MPFVICSAKHRVVVQSVLQRTWLVAYLLWQIKYALRSENFTHVFILA